MSSPSDWIATQSDRGLAMACHAFAQSLNCWSPGGLEALLAEDCHHESQVRFAPVEGRDALVDVFASHAGRPVRTTFYELANEPLHAEPCVLVSFRDSLYGRTGLGQVRSYVSLRLDSSGLIDRSSAISLTPDPKTCARSGIYPGINPKELQAERDYLGELLQPSDLQMYLYFDPALDWAVGSQRLIVEAVAREFGLVHIRQL